MIQTQIKCPPENELIDYLLGKLPEELLPQLESHFEDCAICEETIRGLSATDTLNQFVVSQFVEQADPQPEDRQFVSGLIKKLQLTTFVRGRDRAAIQERAVEVIRLLDEADRAESLGQLGEYRIEELIGAGSTGVVFRAIDRQLDRCVALKVLRPSLGDAARQRFMAEARAAASIEHPNVITIYQVGQHNSLAFIAMQWLPGETLEERLARVTFLPENQVRDIARQIAAGLQAAHHKTLIHRDIKPANIWLCEASDQAIILDFGLARIADEDPHMTSTGMLAGTPNFMSPEQTRGQELDGRSDLFSLGCLMYRAATGKLPFGAGGVLATLQSIQHHQPSVPQELNPNLSPDFSDLVMCLLDKQPANRPSFANDLIYALGNSRESWPFASTRYSSYPIAAQADPQLRLKNSTHLGRWIAAGLLVTLLAAGCLAFGQQIIRIATNQGEIVIETEDENVQVEILAGGEVVRVIDTSTQQRIDIEAGEYQITARDPNNANGEFKISNNRIVLTRGGQQVVSVDLIQESSNANSPNAVTTTEPLFDGKTFNEWLAQLSDERSRAVIAVGMEAIGTLSIDDSLRQERAIDAIRPLIRIHGSASIQGKDDWPTLFNSFFSHIPPELVVQFAIEEIRNGTTESRKQALWNIAALGQIYQGEGLSRIEAHRTAICRNLKTIIKTGVAGIQRSDSANDRLAIRRLVSCAIDTCFSTEMNFGKIERHILDPDIVALLENIISESENRELQGCLAQSLMAFGVDSEVAWSRCCDLLGDPEMPSDLYATLYFNYLALLPDAEFSHAIPKLVTIFESDELCDRLVSDAQPHVGAVNSNRAPGKLIEGLSSPEFDRNWIRNNILQRIGSRGEFATPALPWLDQIAISDSAFKENAANAAKKVRGEDHKTATGDGDETRKVNGQASDETSGDGGGEISASDNPTKKNEDTKKSKSGSELTFEGGTFDEWLNTLAHERSRTAISKGAEALGALSRDDPERQKKAIEALTPMIRANGSNIIANDDDWSSIFNRFFSYLPSETVVQFAIDEIQNGTTESRKQAVWHVLVGQIYKDSPGIKLPNHRRAIREKLTEIIEKGIAEIEQNNSAVDRDAVSMLVRYAIDTCFDTSTWTKIDRRELDPDVALFLKDKLAASSNLDVRSFLVQTLLTYKVDSIEASRAFCELLADPAMPIEMTANLYFNHLDSLGNRDFKLAIPALIRIFENDELCKGLLDYVQQQTRLAQAGGGFFGGNVNSDLLNSDPPPDGETGDASEFPAGLEAVRADILYRIGSRGKFASPALPWLDQIAISNSPFKQHAAIAAKKARGEELKTATGDGDETRKVTGQANDETSSVGGGGVSASDSSTKKTDDTQSSKSSSTLTYEGRTFKQWQELIKTERRFETVQMALNALGSLSTGNEELQEIAIEIVAPLFRSPDDRIAKPVSGELATTARAIHDVFDQFFSYLPPEQVVKFAVNEISEGTIHSRNRLHTLVGNTGVYENAEDRHRFKQAMKEHIDEIVGAVVDLVDQHPGEWQIAGFILQTSLDSAFYDYVKSRGGQYEYERRLPESMISRLEKEMVSTSNDQWAAQFCMQLLKFGIFSKAVQDTLAKQISNPAFHLSHIYSNVLPKLAKSHAAEMVAPLIAIYKSDELSGQLATSQRTKDEVRADIIERFAEFGAAGSTALPWLDEIAAGDSRQKKLAAEAASKIRAAIVREKESNTD